MAGLLQLLGLMRRKDQPVNPVFRTALTALLCAMIVIVCEWAGATRAVDDALATSWVEMRGRLGVGAQDEQSIVVVAVDAPTQAEWGPGPWPASRSELLLARIHAAEPRFVASVGHAPLFAAGESPSIVAHASGTAWDTGGFIHGQLSDEAGSFAKLAAGVGDVSADTKVPVFWRPQASIPVVSALAVERGEITPEQLRGRVVLIGVELPAYTPRVATPLGALSPTMIEAHALHGLLNTPSAAQRPWWWRGAFALTFVGLALALIRTSYSWRGNALAIGLLVGASLVADLVGEARGWLEMGTGLQLVALAALVVVHAGFELLCIQRSLGALQQEILDDQLRNSDTHERTGSQEHEDEDFWLGLARFAAAFVGSRAAAGASSRVYERVDGGMQLRAHVARGSGDEAQAGEGDLRRAPFRRAWQSLSSSARANTSGTGDTLVIPLAVDDRCLGMWRIDLPGQLSADLRAGLETFARRLSRSVAKREAQRQLAAGPQQSIRGRIDLVVDGFELAHVQQRASLELLEELPVPVMLATVWGEAQFVSEDMRELLRGRGHAEPDIRQSQSSDLFRLISALTDNTPGMVRKMMGRVAVTGLTLELGPDRGASDARERMWMLSRVSTQAGRDHLVLSARPRPELEGTPGSDLGREQVTPLASRRRAAR